MTDTAAERELLRNPQATYAMLREHLPVMAIEHELLTGTMLSLHDDVVDALRTPEVFSSGEGAVSIGQIRPLIPLQIDPPDHSKFRKLLDPLFAPKRIAAIESATRALVVSLIERVSSDGACNFHAAVAEPFPSTVFLQMLGLPLSRAGEFIELKDGIIRPDAHTAEGRQAAIAATGQRIYTVLNEVIEARSAQRSDDFISGFLDAEVDGHRLTTDDVVDICYLFFLAGLDTVTASLDCIIAYLAQHPEQRQRLVDNPALIPAAIEELLRWETPVTAVARITAADTEVRGCPIAAGTKISLSIGSANTDPGFWDAPDAVDFDRPTNKHLAFGGGVHRCLGSHLARMELRVALEEWHARVPDYRLADGVELSYSAGLRQVENLELIW
jgi:cytochrome P450